MTKCDLTLHRCFYIGSLIFWATLNSILFGLWRSCQPFDAHCCHTGTAIKHPVPDRVKPSFVILDMRYSDAQGWASECRMSIVTNNALTRSGTGCFIAVPVWQQWASKGYDLWRSSGVKCICVSHSFVLLRCTQTVLLLHMCVWVWMSVCVCLWCSLNCRSWFTACRKKRVLARSSLGGSSVCRTALRSVLSSIRQKSCKECK